MTGEWIEGGEMEYVGLDMVRSDRAEITRDVLGQVLESILRADGRSEAREKVYDIIETTVEKVKDGEYPPSYIARPKGMSKDPEEYGSLTNTPMPTYRGAKYATQHLDHEQLGEGSKPQLLYVDKVRGDYPRTYTAETKEDGTEVDAIAVEHPDKLPDAFSIDVDKMLEKTLEDPLTPILEAMNWSYAESLADTQQGSLEEFF
jgi:DNA polymerase I